MRFSLTSVRPLRPTEEQAGQGLLSAHRELEAWAVRELQRRDSRPLATTMREVRAWVQDATPPWNSPLDAFVSRPPIMDLSNWAQRTLQERAEDLAAYFRTPSLVRPPNLVTQVLCAPEDAPAFFQSGDYGMRKLWTRPNGPRPARTAEARDRAGPSGGGQASASAWRG